MKIFVRLTIVMYVVAGFLLLFGPQNWFPSFYHTTTMGILAFVSAFLILLPQVVLKKHKNTIMFSKFQFLVALSVLINGAGGLGLYRLYLVGFQYDKLTHFVTPLILTVAAFIFLTHFWKWNDKKALIVSAILVFMLGLFWELLEHVANLIFAEGVFVLGGGGSVALDTILDVMANTLGIGVAWMYISKKLIQNK